MVFDANTPVVNVAPRMSKAAFVAWLQSVKSPSADTASAGYDAIVANHVDPLFCAACFWHESNAATNPKAIVVQYQTNNPGNCRSTRTGAGTVINTPRGEFVKYPNWYEGWRDLAFRLIDPSYDYVKEGRTTPGTIVPKFAPESDGNDPDGYLQSVLTFMNQHADLASGGTAPVAGRAYHVAISYGHHNTDGGDAVEKGQTPLLGKAVADACRALGMEVRIVQDEVGLNPDMGLQDIAQKVVDWQSGGWPVDLYLETHTEAGPRGVFAIYPDTGSDVDLDAKRVGQDAAKRIAAAIGIPLRGDGTMSERATGVGAQGYRLGIFLRTAPIKSSCTRMIIEYGSHTDATDLAAVNGHVAEVGMATAQAFAAEAKRLGFMVKDAPDATPQAVDDPNEWTDPVTGFKIVGGMKARWDQLKAALASISPDEVVLVIGRPVENEHTDADTVTRQRFERATWERNPGADPTRYDIQATIINPYEPPK